MRIWEWKGSGPPLHFNRWVIRFDNGDALLIQYSGLMEAKRIDVEDWPGPWGQWKEVFSEDT